MNFSKSKIITVSFILLVGLAADWISKWYFETRLFLYQSITVIENFFKFTLYHNQGFSFSFLQDHPNLVYWLFGINAMVLSIVFLYLSIKKSSSVFSTWGYALIAAGALGNAVDRFLNGYVIDFIHFIFWGRSFPIFNVADILINLGVACMFVAILFKK